MIADLHCHYPMHLLPEDAHPLGRAKGWWQRVKDDFDARAVAVAGHLFNNPHWWQDWRVDLSGLVAGDARLVCSVLYWPASEFRLGSVPAPGSFEYLKSLVSYVEQDLNTRDPAGARHVIATRASDLNQPRAGRVVFVHCVEGGFHLGPDEAAIDANVQWLAEQGVLYITVAHLFFKGVATNAPAIPPLTDADYASLFHQPGVGLTGFGETLVDSMHKHKVLVDISHMSEEAIDDTFKLIEKLDKKRNTKKEDFPVLATHVGMRSEYPGHTYNLTDATAKRIHDRGGLIGVIMAQHLLGETADAAQSKLTLKKHIEAIRRACGGLESCALGTDIDGFIKPTLAGFERAPDFRTLAGWITAEFPTDASAILHKNALRVLTRVFQAREGAGAIPPAPSAAGSRAAPAADGYHHPASEAELSDLVKAATDEKVQLRVRGAAHSVSHAIYADPVAQIKNTVSWQTPPPGPNLNVMLDQYRGWRVIDEPNKVVEVDAGIHLGADPSDPTGTASLQTSLLHQLWQQKGWTLSNLGGITHQTVSGFTATGSSGGSVQFSVNDNLRAFHIIDAAGNVQVIARGDPLFGAMAPNLGVLGVVSKIVLECVDTYNITGQEAISTIEGCAIDLFGAGSGKPSLEQFLRETEYARLLWWPQRGAERVEVWQARGIAAAPGFKPVPYQEFTSHPDVAEAAISILLTVFGNLDDLSQAFPQLHQVFSRVDDFLEVLPEIRKLGLIGTVLAKFLSRGAEVGADAALELLRPFAPLIKHEIPKIFPWLLETFVPLDSENSGPQLFQDYAWHGLPMDNGADDVLLRTAFTEIWVPLTRTGDAMQLLRRYVDQPKDVHEAYQRTGLNGWELYAAKPTDFWLSASHTTGNDEWKEGAFRIDPYWFAANHGDPLEFYEPLWELFRGSDIPFRLHWGKYQPESDPWAAYFRKQYPRWDDFLDLRQTRDPDGRFFTTYWQARLKRIP